MNRSIHMTYRKRAILALAGLVGAIASGGAVAQQPQMPGPMPESDLVWFCWGCHGLDGISTNVRYPNIAGFDANYIEARLKAHRDRRSYHPFMWGAVEFLDDEAIREVAQHYAEAGKDVYTTFSPEELAARKKPAPMELTKVTDNLYRLDFYVSADFQFITAALIWITPEGIVVFDSPLPEAARWLKERIEELFDLPVLYVVYSHHHSDHISGATEFEDEAVIIAHAEAKKALLELRAHDRVLEERGERYTIFEPIPLPDITFNDEMTLTLGGKTVRLFAMRPQDHSEDVIAAHFIDEDALFIVDIVGVKSVGFLDFRRNKFPDIIDAHKFLEQIDFEHLITGHYPIATKAELIEHRQYLETLRDEVAKAIAEGKTREEAMATIRLDQYQHFTGYPIWFDFNVSGAYKALSGGD